MTSSSSAGERARTSSSPASRNCSYGSSSPPVSATTTVSTPAGARLSSSRSTISEAGARVSNDEVDVVRREPGVDRDEDAAGPGNSEVGFEQGGDVRREHGYAVAPPEPALDQRRRQPARPFPELAVCQAPRAVDNGRPLRKDGRASREECDWVELVPEDPIAHPADPVTRPALGSRATSSSPRRLLRRSGAPSS